MQRIISKSQQKILLANIAVNRMSRDEASRAIGVSLPTLRKVLNAEPPLVVNQHTYKLVQTWLGSERTVKNS